MLTNDSVSLCGFLQVNQPQDDDVPVASNIFEFEANDIDGNKVSLSKYKGFVTIIVNVASACGYTKANYEGLNALFEKHADAGLRIAAFPCNQFKNQEKGDSAKIKAFCEKRDVKFDIYEKIEVNGKNAHPLYKYLKHTIGDDAPIKWNFNRFLINKEGVPVKRYLSSKNLEPMETDILEELKK